MLQNNLLWFAMYLWYHFSWNPYSWWRHNQCITSSIMCWWRHVIQFKFIWFNLPLSMILQSFISNRTFLSSWAQFPDPGSFSTAVYRVTIQSDVILVEGDWRENWCSHPEARAKIQFPMTGPNFHILEKISKTRKDNPIKGGHTWKHMTSAICKQKITYHFH